MENFNWREIKNEKARTYYFRQGNFTITNVVRLAVSPSGNHRLETSNGGKYIIPPVFLAILIDSDVWEF